MTALWSQFVEQAIPLKNVRIIIGDCSGGLAQDQCLSPAARVFPLLNFQHGEKLDLFIKKLCQAPYVLVCDDDIFWLSTKPWEWAIEQLECNSRVAVVSLHPREHLSSVLQGQVSTAMGSYCLVIRRELWIKENLSFNVAASEAHDWFYDTGDLANVELERLGYKIIVAPPEIRNQMAVLEAMSTWTLKIQKHRGEIVESIADVPIRQQKALRTVLMLRGLARIAATHCSDPRSSNIVDPLYLDRAEAICNGILSQDEVAEIHLEVTKLLDDIDHRLAIIKNKTI